jgi:predicted anti-sigma-YlaC factor YlaD
MLTLVPPSDCMLARESASARLDGELSELDSVRLDAHLRGCADCYAYSAQIGAIAVQMRAAELEQPGRIVLPRRRRLAGARMQVAVAAAAVAVAAAAAGSSFTLGHALQTRAANPLAAAATVKPQAPVSLQQDIRDEHILALSTRLLAPTTLRAGNFFAV